MENQREYKFKALDPKSNPDWQVKTFTFMYNVPLYIFFAIKSMDDFRLLILLSQSISYGGEVNISSTWRKHAIKSLNTDRQRVHKSLKSLDSLGFISKSGDYRMVNELIFSKGSAEYRKKKFNIKQLL